MERDAAQSILDEAFPSGANVFVSGPEFAFNTARLLVIDDQTVTCDPYEGPKRMFFTPKDITQDGEVVTLVGAAGDGSDVVVRPAPEIPQLVEDRKNVYTDTYLDQLRA